MSYNTFNFRQGSLLNWSQLLVTHERQKHHEHVCCWCFVISSVGFIKPHTCILKGKFSSGIEGALASTLNRRFQRETTIRNDSLYFLFDVFKVYLSNIDSETAEIF